MGCWQTKQKYSPEAGCFSLLCLSSSDSSLKACRQSGQKKKVFPCRQLAKIDKKAFFIIFFAYLFSLIVSVHEQDGLALGKGSESSPSPGAQEDALSGAERMPSSSSAVDPEGEGPISEAPSAAEHLAAFAAVSDLLVCFLLDVPSSSSESCSQSHPCGLNPAVVKNRHGPQAPPP